MRSAILFPIAPHLHRPELFDPLLREKGFETGLEAYFSEGSEAFCEPSQRPTTSRDDSLPDRAHGLVARLAAKARLAEALAQGDLRVLVGEVREGLEALSGAVGDVVLIAGWRR